MSACRPGHPVHPLTFYPSDVAVCGTCKVVVEFPGRPGEAPSETWARWKDAVRAANAPSDSRPVPKGGG